MYIKDISNSADYLDVRDIIARFEELREELPNYASQVMPGTSDELEELREESNSLESLLQSLKGMGGDEEWEGDCYPVTLIRDSYFEDAMDELLEDIGVMPKFDNIPPYITISVNYESLKMDYSSADYDGVTYWFR